MQYSNNGSLKRSPMEFSLLLVMEFDNLCSDVSLVAMVACHGDRHGRTMITCDLWRLTAEAPEVRQGYWYCQTYSFVLCSLYDMLTILLLSNAWIRLQRPALTSMEKHRHDMSWLSVLAPVWSLPLLPMLRLWFVWSLSNWTGPLLRGFVRSPVCCW